MVFLVYKFARYGVSGFYRGQALADQAANYGKGNAGAGLEQAAQFGLQFAAIGLVVLYVRNCLQEAHQILYRYPISLLVLLPILSLRRYDALNGGLAILAILACDRRLSDRLPSVESAAGPRRRASPPFGGRRSHRLVIGLVFIAAITAGALIGNLRRGLTPNTNLPLSSVLTSELTPVQAYGDIKANIERLGHPLGRTIFLPFVLKVIPRGLFPNKPLNSGAYYMSILHPEEWNAGFGIPPTFFGDMYLSFGFGAALVACFALGGVSRWLDQSFKDGRLTRLWLFLLVFASYLHIMRDAASESLAGVAVPLLVIAVAARLGRTKVAPGSGQPSTKPYIEDHHVRTQRSL